MPLIRLGCAYAFLCINELARDTVMLLIWPCNLLLSLLGASIKTIHCIGLPIADAHGAS
jgi:hypothetical protein